MQSVPTQSLVLEEAHTGERIEMRRLQSAEGVSLELRVSLPAGRDGPPLHIHFAEDEGGTVTAGVLGAQVGDEKHRLGVGESATFPRGVPHRWWNEGPDMLEIVAYAKPVVDLDRYLQAVFEVLGSSPEGRPSLIYMAHIVRRHRDTQRALLMPGPIQKVVFALAYAVGTLLGKYRGTDWPGCPDRCTGAPTVHVDEG